MSILVLLRLRLFIYTGFLFFVFYGSIYFTTTSLFFFFLGNLYIHVKCNAPLNGFIARYMA